MVTRVKASTVAPTRHHPPQPHDLLWVDTPSALTAVDTWPAWATPAWRVVAPVVVRRAPTRSGDRLPVGVRGATRSERCAAHAIGSHIIRSVTPEEVARRASTRADLVKSPRACLRALARLTPPLAALALPWGVTGSVGFSLASGFDVLRAESDLDLLVRVASRRDAIALRVLATIVQAAECRVDVQVEAPRGAFALNEWTRTGGPVLLKTSLGPALCEDPWDGTASSVESSSFA